MLHAKGSLEKIQKFGQIFVHKAHALVKYQTGFGERGKDSITIAIAMKGNSYQGLQPTSAVAAAGETGRYVQ